MTWDQALVWAGGLACAIASITALIAKITGPVKKLEDRVRLLEAKVKETDAFLKADLESFKAQEDVNILMLESLTLLLQHGATGNHNSDMESMAHKINSFVLTKGGKLK